MKQFSEILNILFFEMFFFRIRYITVYYYQQKCSLLKKSTIKNDKSSKCFNSWIWLNKLKSCIKQLMHNALKF